MAVGPTELFKPFLVDDGCSERYIDVMCLVFKSDED